MTTDVAAGRSDCPGKAREQETYLIGNDMEIYLAGREKSFPKEED